MNFPFKVICIDSGPFHLTKGKVYEVIGIPVSLIEPIYMLKEDDSRRGNAEFFQKRFKLAEEEKVVNIYVETNETTTLTHENKLLSCVITTKNNDIKNAGFRFTISNKVGLFPSFFY